MADVTEALHNPGTRQWIIWGAAVAVALALYYYYKKSQAGGSSVPSTSTPQSQLGTDTTGASLLAANNAVTGLAGEIQSGILGLAGGVHAENQQIANYLESLSANAQTNASTIEVNQSDNFKALANQFASLQNWLAGQFTAIKDNTNSAAYYSAGAESFAACRVLASRGTVDPRGGPGTAASYSFDPDCLKSKGTVGVPQGGDPNSTWNSTFSSCVLADGSTDFTCVGKKLLGVS